MPEIDTQKLVDWLNERADFPVLGPIYAGISDRIRRGDFDAVVDCPCGGDLEPDEHCNGCGRTGRRSA